MNNLMQSDNLMNDDTKIWFSVQVKCDAPPNYAYWINYAKMNDGTEPKTSIERTLFHFRINIIAFIDCTAHMQYVSMCMEDLSWKRRQMWTDCSNMLCKCTLSKWYHLAKHTLFL